MAKLESNYSVFADSMESSRKRKLACLGDPLPYLIRPRRKLPAFDMFTIYNAYAESESDDEDVPPMKNEAVEVKTEQANSSDLDSESDDDTSSEKCGSNTDDEYVIVSDVDEFDSITVRKGAIQMLELSKDVPVSGVSVKDETESEDEDVGSESEGSNSDDSDGDEWVVV